MHFSALPRGTSKSNNTILQFKPLNQPVCCLGELVTFFSPDHQKHVLFCLYPSFLIPNFALVRHCPSTLNKRTLFGARSAASFISLSLWLHTRFKAVFPAVSWALFLPLHCTSFVSLSPLWCHGAFSLCLLPGLSLLDATSRGCIGPSPFTESQEHPLTLDFPSLQGTASSNPIGLSL